MNKKELFIKALANDKYKFKDWVIRAFAIVNDPVTDITASTEQSLKTGYAYKIIRTPTGVFFLDPNNDLAPARIEDADISKPLYGMKEKVSLLAGDVYNLSDKVETTYGQALWNSIVLVFPFKKKIPYMQGRISVGDVEKIIIKRLVDNPKEGETVPDDKISVQEYTNFVDAVMYISQYTQLCVPAATKRTMLPAPGIFEYRDKLLAENKDKLNDPAVIATIDAALVKYDKEAMKDDLASGFLISGKSFNVVRKKLFGMYGSEAGFTDGIEVDNIGKSLSEGWDIDKFPVMNNASRAGSFNRGAETQLGGEAVKWLLRASSNLRVVDSDCGTKIGKLTAITETNYERLVGFSIIGKDNKPIKINTIEEALSYRGKVVSVRSPMYCNHNETDYCATCVGNRLAEHPTALASAVSDYGSTFMGIFMKAMHGKQLALAKFNYKTAIS